MSDPRPPQPPTPVPAPSPSDDPRAAERDAPRDPRLQTALRHAPDHTARPPAAIEARIFEAARRAASPADPPSAERTPPRAGWRQRIADAIEALLRPGPAAAFASLMLATVIGVMWRDGPPPESTAGMSETASSTPVAREKPAEAAAAVSEDRPSEAARSAPPQAPVTATSTPPTAAVEGARERADAGGAGRAESARVAPGAPSQRSADAAPRRAETSPANAAAKKTDAGNDGRDSSDARDSSEARRELSSASDTPAAPRARAAAPASPSEAAIAPPVVTAAPTLPSRALAEAKASAAPPAAAAPMGLASTAAADPLAPVIGRLATRPPADRDRPASEASEVPPMPERIDLANSARWANVLNELRQLTAGRWSMGPLPGLSGAVRRTIPAADGTPQGELIVTGDAVTWQPRDQTAERAWRAPLAADEAVRLRARLAALPPVPPRDERRDGQER